MLKSSNGFPLFQCDRPGSTPAPPRSSQANDAWHPRRDALLVEIQGQELRTVDANERLDVGGWWRLVAVGGGWWNQKDREDAARKCGKINWKKVWIMD